MIISHRYKFIFIKTRKTAGTSVEVYLSQVCGAHDIVTPVSPPVAGHQARHHRGLWNPSRELRAGHWSEARSALRDLIRARKFYNHIHAETVRRRISAATWNSYFKFCVERNPWDKTLSHYHYRNHKEGGQLTFERYIERGAFCLNYPFYTSPAGSIIVDRVVRYESLDTELADIFRALGVPFEGALTVRAKGSHRDSRGPYRERYTAAQRAVIERAFAREIELLGYSF